MPGVPHLGDSQFHVDLVQDQVGSRPHPEVQGNGEIPRPPLEKGASQESSEEVDMANGKHSFIM